MNASMYRTVVGADFDRLAPAVRRFHSLQGRHLLEESGSPGRLHFDVRATVPFVGLVTRYCGYIELPAEEDRR